MTAGLIIALLIAAALIVLAIRFYRRTDHDVAFVRSGLGGTKVVMGGGTLVLPLLHHVTRVNMNTMRLEVSRTERQALISGDRIRADVIAEFYVRVQPDRQAVRLAAQTVGSRTMNPEDLKYLVEGKFVDALRSVAAERTMEELHANRRAFAGAVEQVLQDSLAKNGLELESVSITSLDQTPIEYFSPSNAFDAEGLTRLTEQIENRKKKRHEVEQESSLAIQRKTLETEKRRLEIDQESEYARLQQQYEIAARRAQQQAEIAESEADGRTRAEDARLGAERVVESRRIELERALEELRIAQRTAARVAESRGDAELAGQQAQSAEAEATLEAARAELERARERVAAARETEAAERVKAVELINTEREASRQTSHSRILAESERALIEMQSEVRRIKAETDAETERLATEARLGDRKAEAEALRLHNEARNALEQVQVNADERIRLIETLPQVVQASADALKAVESVRVVKVDGLTGRGGGSQGPDGSDGHGMSPSGGLARDVLRATLDYRAEAPLVDELLREVGLTPLGGGASRSRKDPDSGSKA
jgi:uncharacterized membrane protein YqiK